MADEIAQNPSAETLRLQKEIAELNVELAQLNPPKEKPNPAPLTVKLAMACVAVEWLVLNLGRYFEKGFDLIEMSIRVGGLFLTVVGLYSLEKFWWRFTIFGHALLAIFVMGCLGLVQFGKLPTQNWDFTDAVVGVIGVIAVALLFTPSSRAAFNAKPK